MEAGTAILTCAYLLVGGGGMVTTVANCIRNEQGTFYHFVT